MIVGLSTGIRHNFFIIFTSVPSGIGNLGTNFTNRHMEPCIIIHGGCRTIPNQHQESVRQGVKLAARIGYDVLLEVKL